MLGLGRQSCPISFAERGCDWTHPMWSWNVFPSFAIWVTHLVQEEVCRRQQEPEWDVLGLSSRSYLLSWQLMVHTPNKNGKIYRACVQSGGWHMRLKHGWWRLARKEWIMVRWMCGVTGVSLMDRKRSVDLYSLLCIQSVVGVVWHSRLRWFGCLEHRNVDDWVLACRNVFGTMSVLLIWVSSILYLKSNQIKNSLLLLITWQF